MSKVRTGAFVLGGLLVALVLAGVVSNFASGSPDGLDSTARRGCTLDEAGEITGGSCMAQGERDHELGDSPFADYSWTGIENELLATTVAGVLGVLVTFAVGGGIFWLVRRRGSTHVGSGDTHVGSVAGSTPAGGTGAGDTPAGVTGAGRVPADDGGG